MSVTIDLPNEIYERLEKQAQALGMTIAEAVAQALQEAEAARISAFWERMEAKGLVAGCGKTDAGGRALCRTAHSAATRAD